LSTLVQYPQVSLLHSKRYVSSQFNENDILNYNHVICGLSD